MTDKRIMGKLTINTDNNPLELDILSGILDRSFCSFDFNSGSKKNIDGYNLMLDVSDLGKEALRDLENIIHNIDKTFKVAINLGGENKKGEAKIAENLSFTGISVDLELSN